MATVTLTEAGPISGARTSRAPLVIVGLSFAWIVMVVVFCLAGPLIAPYSATAQNLTTGMAGPSSQHWLGTDSLGTDVLSIIIVGARTAVIGRRSSRWARWRSAVPWACWPATTAAAPIP